MAVKRGDIVIGQFFKDKTRPGVVVRASRFEQSENLTLCPITSRLVGHELRPPVSAGASGLKQDSEVMTYRLTTLPQARVGRVIGRLTAEELHTVDDALKLWLDL